jgi:hypothetical protein
MCFKVALFLKMCLKVALFLCQLSESRTARSLLRFSTIILHAIDWIREAFVGVSKFTRASGDETKSQCNKSTFLNRAEVIFEILILPGLHFYKRPHSESLFLHPLEGGGRGGGLCLRPNHCSTLSVSWSPAGTLALRYTLFLVFLLIQVLFRFCCCNSFVWLGCLRQDLLLVTDTLHF